MTDQSDAGNPTARPDTDAVKRTVKPLVSHCVTRERDSPANSLRTPNVRVEPLGMETLSLPDSSVDSS
eukprot:1000713-Prorocentrum_minimum.AAC.1